MRINWFSPIAPQSTAISDFSDRLLGSLVKEMEVVLWTDADVAPGATRSGIPVRSVRGDMNRYWRELNFADFSVYNIGNDPRFHGRFAEILERHPGIVVLHDYNLHELHRERLRHGPGGDAAYHLYVYECAGLAGLRQVELFESGDLLFESLVAGLPLVEKTLASATGVVAFNPALEPLLLEHTQAPLLLTPLPYGPEAAFPQALEKRFESGNGPLEVVMFGYLNSPNRRLTEVLEALRSFSTEEVRLTLFGHIEDRASFDRKVAEAGLGDRIRFLGFLDEAEMDTVLRESHLAINLRHPSRGESSDALLKAWTYALPVLVSRTAYYATLPEDTVFFVEPGEEASGLASHLKAFLKTPATYFASGLAGHRRLVQEHASESFVRTFSGFLRGAVPYRQRAFAHPFSQSLRSRFAFLKGTGEIEQLARRRLAGELAGWVR